MTRIAGLYAVADTAHVGGAGLVAAVEAALRGGASVVQLRCKGAPGERLEAARLLLPQCHRHGVPLIINDDVEAVRATGAQGVHLGRDDADPARARDMLGPDAIIGVSCYADAGLAGQAQRAGADYVAFGSVYPSRVKPRAVHASLDVIRLARTGLQVPIVAIGGITPENTPALLRAGVDAVAVITGLFGAEDVCEQARRFVRCFEATRGQP